MLATGLFSGTSRGECVSRNLFRHRIDAGWVIKKWRRDYGEGRRQASLGCLTPAEFKLQSQSNSGCVTARFASAIFQASLVRRGPAGH